MRTSPKDLKKFQLRITKDCQKSLPFSPPAPGNYNINPADLWEDFKDAHQGIEGTVIKSSSHWSTVKLDCGCQATIPTELLTHAPS